MRRVACLLAGSLALVASASAAPANVPTFSRDVAPIMFSNCATCHRAGEVAPMTLTSYEDARPWAKVIKNKVVAREMPPWGADPAHSLKMRNDRSLTQAQIDTIVAWVDGGAPKGSDADLPQPKTFAQSWSIGTPDVVFEMPKEFNVPAKAPARGVPYQNFMVSTNFKEDVWIQAAEAKPGNYAVVHHIIVYVLETTKSGPSGDGIGKGMLVAYAPGDIGSVYPVDSAKRVPKGATLVFQLHYTPNGVAQSDRSKVGLVFAKAPPKYEVSTRGIAQQAITILPQKDDQKFFKDAEFKNDVLVWALMPHMHLRGKAFQFEAVYSDGKRETLLSVPRYDFAWQTRQLLCRRLQVCQFAAGDHHVRPRFSEMLRNRLPDSAAAAGYHSHLARQ